MDEKKNLPENILDIKKLDLWYGENHALKNVNMEIKRNAITAFIGPSGCGKSTFLKTLNRMNDLVPGVRIEGQVLLDGVDIYDPKVDTSMLRKKIGMVFQQPNPFPMSIYDNVAYGPRIHGIKNKVKLDQIVEESLKGAAIFDEVKDRLKKSALGLSGGQQQRLCIARALAVSPEVLLMDEPTNSLDLQKQLELCEIIKEITRHHHIGFIVVLHDLNLAARFGDRVFVFDGNGGIYNQGSPEEVFTENLLKDVYGVHAEIRQDQTGVPVIIPHMSVRTLHEHIPV